jgi:hypothetical protein
LLLREKADKWDYSKLKSFYTAKEKLTRLIRQPMKWEFFANYVSARDKQPEFTWSSKN